MRAYIKTSSVVEFDDDAPSYCWVELTPEFLTLVRKLQGLCKDHDLARCAAYCYADGWQGVNEDGYSIEGETLIVTDCGFYFQCYRKHEDIPIESSHVEFTPLEIAMEAARSEGRDHVFFGVDEEMVREELEELAG
ncbi:hypothetical protein [Thioalkalivibrio thiocyanodenitrificans]|uniref:hypothetical protein n=1 Tax=Thioalkalivibrio thiocyanodenitrificans TaxID=243063 RepID=UPI000382C1C2|nr:hypothetical protein [Thioalkalivibrio thiocyanodenitrificans]